MVNEADNVVVQFFKLILLTVAVYWAPFFTIVMMIGLVVGLVETPPYYIMNVLTIVNVIALITDIFALKNKLMVSGGYYLRFKIILVYFGMYAVLMALGTGFFEFKFSYDKHTEGIFKLLLILLGYIIFTVFTIVYCCKKTQHTNSTDNEIQNENSAMDECFLPTFKHFFFALFVAMLLSGGELLFTESGIMAIPLFPSGLFVLISILAGDYSLAQSTVFWLLGWFIYSVVICFGTFLRSRTAWYIFLVLLLINIGGCRITILGLYNIR